MIRIPSTCTGCHACAAICPKKCIDMKDIGEGFLFPVIHTETCIQCNRCEEVCPVLHIPGSSHQTQVFALKNKDEAERKKSTSGGVFPLLARRILDAGGIIYGAAYDSDFSVKHIAVEDSENLSLLQGTKYVQSTVGRIFPEVKDHLKAGQQVLFSGTPCQCAGLRAFLGKEHENLMLVDLICHGVPSPKVWQTYIDYRARKENGGKRPVKINMRSKVNGWSRYSTEFDYGNGKIARSQNSEDPFIRAFVGNICLRSSCSECLVKGTERCTDLTLGDYWGIWSQHSEFNDEKGTSIVFVHSAKGMDMLNWVKDQTEWLEIPSEDAYRENMSMVSSSQPHEKRNEFLDRITSDNFGDVVREYFPPVPAKKLGVWEKVKGKLAGIIR